VRPRLLSRLAEAWGEEPRREKFGVNWQRIECFGVHFWRSIAEVHGGVALQRLVSTVIPSSAPVPHSDDNHDGDEVSDLICGEKMNPVITTIS